MTCPKTQNKRQNPALGCPILPSEQPGSLKAYAACDVLTPHFHVDWRCLRALGFRNLWEETSCERASIHQNQNLVLEKEKKEGGKKKSCNSDCFRIAGPKRSNNTAWDNSRDSTVLESEARDWALSPASPVRRWPVLMSIFYWCSYVRKQILSFMEGESSSLPNSTAAAR